MITKISENNGWDLKVDNLEQFHCTLRTFVSDAIQILTMAGIPFRNWTRVVPKDGGHTELPNEIRIDFSGAITKIMYIVDKMPSFFPLIDAINSNKQLSDKIFVDAVGQPINHTIGQHSWVTNMIINPFLNAYFKQTMTIEFIDKVFNSLFQQIVEDIESPMETRVFLAPILNIELEQDEILFSTGVKLRLIIGSL